jgi:hypothetical protein
MQEIFEAAWKVMNIEITFEGFKFALWHPMAFTLLISIIIKILLFKSKED